MTRLLLCAGAALLLASGALAEKTGKKTAAVPTEVNCPIMAKNKVNIKAATAKKMYADHKGRRYFFCCAGCPEAFKKDPAKYAKAPSIPTPKAK